MPKNILISVAIVLTVVGVAGSAHAAVTIKNRATRNMNCAAGVCTPTAKNAVLNTNDLQTMLATSDVTVNTGANAVSIAVSAPLTWASTSRLTLNASNSISIKAAVVVEGTGAMTLTPGQGGSGAGLNFFPGGSISFWDNASSLIIAGQSYALVSDLATLNSDVASNPLGRYALAKNYDATGVSFSDSPVQAPLTGTFEGLGNTISNLFLLPFYRYTVGLFTENAGTVRDVIVQANMDCTSSEFAEVELGLVVGENHGLVRNIAVTGSIKCPAARIVGGAVGNNLAPGAVMNVTANVALQQSKMHYSGGLVGNNTGMILNSLASGNVAGAYAGGLVGQTSGTIQDSHASGQVTNSASDTGLYLGGLAGIASGTILRCSATGNVSGKGSVGGLVGQATSLTIDSSFATGTATSLQQQSGGLVGYGSGVTVVNSYARGAEASSGKNLGYAGGLAGELQGVAVTASYSTGAPSGAKLTGGSVGDVGDGITMSSAYWDLDTSGITDPSKGAGNQANYPGLIGLSDTQLKSALPSGFDPAVWSQSASINNGYPYLLANPPPL
jgi:hypothetical protein